LKILCKNDNDNVAESVIKSKIESIFEIASEINYLSRRESSYQNALETIRKLVWATRSIPERIITSLVSKSIRSKVQRAMSDPIKSMVIGSIVSPIPFIGAELILYYITALVDIHEHEKTHSKQHNTLSAANNALNRMCPGMESNLSEYEKLQKNAQNGTNPDLSTTVQWIFS
jgi:hypothetical protein